MYRNRKPLSIVNIKTKFFSISICIGSFLPDVHRRRVKKIDMENSIEKKVFANFHVCSSKHKSVYKLILN